MIKDLLHQIDTKSSVISNSVDKSIMQLTSLFSNVLNKVVEDQNKVEIPDVTVDNNLEKGMEEKRSIIVKYLIKLQCSCYQN